MERLKQIESVSEPFVGRHVGPDAAEVAHMLDTVGFASLDALVDATVPGQIRMTGALEIPEAMGESEAIAYAAEVASENQVTRPFIGMGYHPTITPPVIQRNVLENPGWYTQYTPYQAEISQGRLEACLNFQTMMAELTGMDLANASLLDEGTAAAEAMTLAFGVSRGKKKTFLVDEACHPQTFSILKTRAQPVGIQLRVGSVDAFAFDSDVFGALVQNPATDGKVRDLTALCATAHDAGALVIVAADPMSLVITKSPGEMGADIVVGTTQRFGVPLGFGGPHAAYMATREAYQRRLPGRIVGVSVDKSGEPALRLALQTREQHIRRDRATSNICTSQVLLAVMASMYAVYHGPKGLHRIASRIHLLAETFRAGLRRLGLKVADGPLFDTVKVGCSEADWTELKARLDALGYEIRRLDSDHVTVSFDEPTTAEELEALLVAFGGGGALSFTLAEAAQDTGELGAGLKRQGPALSHPIFDMHHSEHELLRYMNRLQAKDLSLTTSMIPLGSCTMKLNATAEMLPVTMPGFGSLHPFTDVSHTKGYQRLIGELEGMLASITGLPGVSLQPNAGSQGEYAGLLAIREYHAARGEADRNICLIPGSAHGTNPASAVMAGMKVVVVKCDDVGNVDLEDLAAKAEKHGDALSCIMVTYPSTHGVFEDGIVKLCDIVHQAGGQVYMDGANMNAQVGLCRPGDFGVDVCHLNLHKTFCIPHGGGGPGVGPIAVAAHLAPHLPGHLLADLPAGPPVSAAPWGSAGILPISWMYIRLLGGQGLKRASQVAILNANYLMTRLQDAYKILYRGEQGTCAHEFIVDIRPLKKSSGVGALDVAKRLMDYGFHAPTMSFPVAGTLMIEPTESETQGELDRFAEAMLAIREEIRAIEEGRADAENNLLHGAPHTAREIASDTWDHPYSREEAAFPAPYVRAHKFWPAVGRVDDAYGDRNLVCSCLPLEAYES